MNPRVVPSATLKDTSSTTLVFHIGGKDATIRWLDSFGFLRFGLGVTVPSLAVQPVDGGARKPGGLAGFDALCESAANARL